MSRSVFWLSYVLGGAAAVPLGCASKGLPPGTPPPEYEQRTLEPWPPAPDAGTAPAADAGPVDIDASVAPLESDAGGP